jgi:DNA repair protein RecO (recombination protein O)
MEWRDEGVILAARRHGEGAAIVEVFTAGHGRHAGVVKGGGSRRMAPLLQPGAQVAVEWTARLEEHIGTFRLDPVRSRAGDVIGDGAALAALAAVIGLTLAALPERAAHPALYARTVALLDALGGAADWPAAYARWEVALLGDLGFGLDLARCAVTGDACDLAYVSPRTGRAVSRAGAGAWADRLLPLPSFLLDDTPPPDGAALADALALSGFFLERRLAPTLPRERLPAARARAVAAILSRAGDDRPDLRLG